MHDMFIHFMTIYYFKKMKAYSWQETQSLEKSSGGICLKCYDVEGQYTSSFSYFIKLGWKGVLLMEIVIVLNGFKHPGLVDLAFSL